MSDYLFWFRLDRDPVLECRYYDEPFTAMTDDGLQATGPAAVRGFGLHAVGAPSNSPKRPRLVPGLC